MLVKPKEKSEVPAYGRSLAADLERIGNDPYFISVDKYPVGWDTRSGEIGRWMNTRYMYWGNKIVPMKK